MKASPVEILLQTHIQIQRKSEISVYIQVAQQLLEAIQRGSIANGEKMPGTRKMSTILNIHRNTVIAVYEEMAAQGFLEIIPNKGSFVQFSEAKKNAIKAQNPDETSKKRAGFLFETALHLKQDFSNSDTEILLNEGKPDFELIPIYEFTKQFKAAMQRKNLAEKWYNKEQIPNAHFEKQLCNYLKISRGISANPKMVLSTRTPELSLYITAQILIKKGQIVLVGTLSNPNVNMVFQQVGATIKTIPQDENGLDISYIAKKYKKGMIRAVYISANNEYPTTVCWSDSRRLALYELAKKYEFMLIESDYAFDYQYNGKPTLPMMHHDTHNLIVYLGSIGSGLFPTFESGFMVATEDVIAEAQNYLQLVDKQGDAIQKQVLSEALFEGELQRRNNINNSIYQKRLDFLCMQLTHHFQNCLTFKKPKSGLALWIAFEPAISLLSFAKAAEKEGVYLPKELLFQNQSTCAIRLGFGQLTESKTKELVQKLKIAYNKIIRKSGTQKQE